MKIGRNDPCPCGSGKKYKNCCLGKTTTSSQEFHYRRLSEAYNRLEEHLFAHADRIFGKKAVAVAMDEFLPWPESEGDVDSETLRRAGPLFWPWYIFNWEYDSGETDVQLSGPEHRTVAELYAENRTGRIDPLEARLIEGINRKPYSFWEVVSIDKGKGMTLQDILKGIQIDVQERLGSQYIHPGDVLFGRAVIVDGVGMLIGLAPTVIPLGRKTEIIQLRKRLRGGRSTITDETLYEWDAEIRELYFDIDHSLHTLPKMCNTDGHLLEFHRLVYEVSSANEAFSKLSDLCVTMTPEELYADAERDDAGRVVHVEFPWNRRGHKKISGMPNTTLGNIAIDGHRLTVEVNSAERDDALRREIAKRLGDVGRFKIDEIQDLEAMMDQHADKPAKKENAGSHEELMRLPEVQAQVAKILSKHWESWPDQKIPALGGITPRKAVKTRDGREAVEALLRDAERDRGQDLLAEANRKGAQRVREMLGLNQQ